MKVFLVSLGCDKNLVDSEHISGILQSSGYTFTDDESDADIIIINSCCFINDAKEESINTIFEMAKYKKDKCKALVLAGCLAQRYHDEIEDEIPEIDICIGTTAFDDIAKTLDEYFKANQKIVDLEDINCPAGFQAPREISTFGGYGYLKIAEGCDKHCTYCIIPKVRGDFRSVPLDNVLDEARQMASLGIKEINLIAQETTMYGIDIYGKKSLHILIHELSKIDGIKWIRILYCYPEDIYDDLIDEIKNNEKVCHYLDLPIQHASDRILKLMGRQTTQAEIKSKIDALKKAVPDIVLRTTLISGFPGESEKDHKEVLDFVEDIKFDRLGVFTYSQEEGTPAADMDNQVEEDVKVQRRNEIMELQQGIVFEKNENFVGEEFEAIIEGKIPMENAYIGRTYMDAPGVDSNIFVVTDEELMSGDFVKVSVTGANDYDLIGDLAERLED
ncbi:MAG: 30S ribosomal protein S12 methylthiotransferase RimO [Eubacterium sp.]|nr:30S ribosomal protein S12 methylthiotransferase RimO [Eubacterium sp.]